VTFPFTDVEGLTRLLREHGSAYADLVAAHRRALRGAFAAHGGVEVDTQGNAFFVAFSSAADAAAAEAGRRALDGGPIPVRMGIHTGEPLVTEEGYVGLDVHRAARIAAAAHACRTGRRNSLPSARTVTSRTPPCLTPARSATRWAIRKRRS
jgi:class 3 adenylate cyclase